MDVFTWYSGAHAYRVHRRTPAVRRWGEGVVPLTIWSYHNPYRVGCRLVVSSIPPKSYQLAVEPCLRVDASPGDRTMPFLDNAGRATRAHGLDCHGSSVPMSSNQTPESKTSPETQATVHSILTS